MCIRDRNELLESLLVLGSRLLQLERQCEGVHLVFVQEGGGELSRGATEGPDDEHGYRQPVVRRRP